MWRATLLFALAGMAHAQTLRDLIGEALRHSPEVAAAQKRYEAMRQKPAQERTLPDPMLQAGYASSGGIVPGQGLGVEPVANIGFMAGQEFPFPGKLKLRGEIASKEAAAEFEDWQAAQLSVISRMKQAWHKLHHAYAASEVLERNADLLERMLKAAEARYAAGKAMQVDLLRTQTQITALGIRRIQLKQERDLQEAEINALTGRRIGTPVPRPEDPADVTFDLKLDNLLKAAEANAPMLRKDRKMIERADLAVNLAKKEVMPDYAINAGYYNMGRMPDMFEFRVDVKLPVWSWRKQRATMTEQVNLRQAAQRSFEATGQGLLKKVQEDFLMAQAAAQLMELYQKTLSPQAGLTFESSLTTYESGGADLMTVLTNVMAMLEYELNWHEAQMDHHLALARLEEMTGLELLP